MIKDLEVRINTIADEISEEMNNWNPAERPGIERAAHLASLFTLNREMTGTIQGLQVLLEQERKIVTV